MLTNGLANIIGVSVKKLYENAPIKVMITLHYILYPSIFWPKCKVYALQYFSFQNMEVWATAVAISWLRLNGNDHPLWTQKQRKTYEWIGSQNLEIYSDQEIIQHATQMLLNNKN